MSAKSKQKRQPFAHAADLPGAYRDLRDLLRELAKPRYDYLWDFKYLSRMDVRIVSDYGLIENANELEKVASELRAAARRVLAARCGEEAAARQVAQGGRLHAA